MISKERYSHPVEAEDRLDDIGALAYRLARRVMEKEAPILEGAGISMWEYAILTALATGPVESQTELAKRTGRDTTRLIGHLDALAAAGLIDRAPLARDRRQHRISLTEAGRRTYDVVRQEIGTMERGILRALPAARRSAFHRDLATMATDTDPR